MHHNRSLLPDEVLLGAMAKTSTYSNKLLFVIQNFYWRKIILLTKFLKKSTKFTNFDQNSEFWPEFIISTELQYFGQMLQFQPIFIFNLINLNQNKEIYF